MKKAIVALLLCALPVFGRGAGTVNIAAGTGQTEEIINNILNDAPSDGASGTKEKGAAVPDAAADKKKTAAPADGGTIPAKEKKGAAAKEDTAPKISSEEQLLQKTGIDFYNSGMYEAALKNFQDLSTKFPQGAYKDSAHFWTGKIYMKLYRYDEAIKEFSAIARESGDYPAAIYFTGESYRMKGEAISSIEYFQKVQSMFPTNELADKALLNAGMIYLNQQKGTQALETAVKLLKLYKDRDTVDDAYYLMGKVYEKDSLLKDIETARKIYRQFLKKGETDERFGKSPLRKRVQEDLQRIDRTYFKMEK